jgi:hypothetical protein
MNRQWKMRIAKAYDLWKEPLLPDGGCRTRKNNCKNLISTNKEELSASGEVWG